MAQTPPPRDDFGEERQRAHAAMVEPIVWAIIYAGAINAGSQKAGPFADRGLALYRERFVNDPKASATGDDA